jgi:cell pole-organizing protein PopZ
MHPPVEQQPAAAVAEPVLVAQEAAAATSASIGQLLRTLSQTQADPAPAPVPAEPPMLVSLGGPTLEDMVRSELRGLLKQWLDTHLPSMVERLVHSEIQRLVSR